jgi:hypothetical protein
MTLFRTHSDAMLRVKILESILNDFSGAGPLVIGGSDISEGSRTFSTEKARRSSYSVRQIRRQELLEKGRPLALAPFQWGCFDPK